MADAVYQAGGIMLRRPKIPALLAVVLAASGCLKKETTHTLYLSPDSGLRWVVDESGVHSDESEPGRRVQEEQAYIGPALIGAHRIAQGLQAIGPDGPVRTTVVRDERPFHVVTDARFVRVDRAFDRLFAACGIKAAVTLSQEAGRSSLHMRFDFTREVEERETPARVLLEDLENFRFVLTEGRFVAGGGFDVQDRTRAVISREWVTNVEAARSAGREVELTLVWDEE
jgi:hypothetical protein